MLNNYFLKVYFYKNDYNALCTEVYKHQHIETGGTLFGLWTTSGSAVIHVLLGPGKNCKRTTTSFHQDIEYMHRVGRFVNNNYMLCHIGEWYSRYSQSLNRPSDADQQTVRRNFPQGVTKFLVIIANTENSDTIVLSPYFSTDEGRPYEKAEFVVLNADGPYSNDTKILKQIQLGAEDGEYQRSESNHKGASLTTTENQQGVTASPTYSQVVLSGSQKQTHNADLNHQPQLNDNISFGHSQATSTSSQAWSPTNHHPPEGGAVQNLAVDDENKASPKDVIVKEVYDHILKFFGSEGNVEIERTGNGDVQMKFQHENKMWMIRFPEAFPNQPAKIFSGLKSRFPSSLSQCHDYYLEKPLTNHVNILLSIKKCCYMSCTICQNINKKNLKKHAEMRPVSTKVAAVVDELTNDIKMTLSTPLTFSDEGQTDGSYRIEFEHYYSKWSIDIPAQFPDKPALVFKIEKHHSVPIEKTINDSSVGKLEKQLISANRILLAIRSNCYCSQCYRVN